MIELGYIKPSRLICKIKMQICSYLQDYEIQEDIVTFKVNLNILVECLNIFGGSTVPGVTPALKLCYEGYGSPLILL